MQSSAREWMMSIVLVAIISMQKIMFSLFSKTKTVNVNVFRPMQQKHRSLALPKPSVSRMFCKQVLSSRIRQQNQFPAHATPATSLVWSHLAQKWITSGTNPSDTCKLVLNTHTGWSIFMKKTWGFGKGFSRRVLNCSSTVIEFKAHFAFFAASSQQGV